MNSLSISFLLLSTLGVLTLPRRYVPLPLLAAASLITYGQGLDVGPFTFTVIRILIAVGVLRVIVRGERLAGGVNGLDCFILAWAFWNLLSSLGHQDVESALVFRLGMVYDSIGIYFLIRAFCQSLDDVITLCKITAVILLPVAIEMLHEKLTGHNLFSILGGVSETSVIREGRIRAQGPFMHPILAGTVGAVCLPLMVGLSRHNRCLGLLGIAATIMLVWACGSSGPVMSTVAAIVGLFMWSKRAYMRSLRWAVLLCYLALDVLMNAPAYYLIARIDLAGGSTGWHRAALIESALKHFTEWWLMGTDYTRHWMPTGVTWSPNHTDITNYYIKMGVVGGLPLMLLFIAILAKAFSCIGDVLKQQSQLSSKALFVIWSMGASVFAQTATCIAVSYFDQSFVFLYMTLAVIGSTWWWSVALNFQERMEPDRLAFASENQDPSGTREIGYQCQ